MYEDAKTEYRGYTSPDLIRPPWFKPEWEEELQLREDLLVISKNTRNQMVWFSELYTFTLAGVVSVGLGLVF